MVDPGSPHSTNRRGGRPLPFMPIAMPPRSFSTFSLLDSCASHPPTPGHHRRAVHEVQRVLYGGRGSRDEIAFTVEDLYDPNATFENPLTLAKGRAAISEMFALLSLVPGSMHSEAGEVAEAQGYEGNHLAFIQHTLHIAFLPFLDPNHSAHAEAEGSPHRASSLRRAYSFFSLPSTPHPQHTPTGVDHDVPPALYSKTHASGPSAGSPISNLISSLMPRNLAITLTTIHLKLTTRLVFNEHGKIILHEDTWGLKEVIEGLFPIASHLYSVNRQGLGMLAGLASRVLLGSGKPKADEEAGWKRRKLDAEGAPGMATPEHDVASDGQPVHRNEWEGTEALVIGSRTTKDLDHDWPKGSPIPTRKSSISHGSGKKSSALGIDLGTPDYGVAEVDAHTLGSRLSAEMSTTVDKGEDSA